MADEHTPIVCRQCEEVITTDIDNCPHCGQATRGIGQWVAVGFGVLVIIGSAISYSSPSDIVFFLVGILFIGIGAALIRDERDRIAEARERSDEFEEPE